MDRQILQSSKFWKSYTSLAADKDLRADGPGGATGPNALVTRPMMDCREILVVSGGALVLVNPNGGTDTTPTLAPGTVLRVQAQKIVAAGTTATAVMVFW